MFQAEGMHARDQPELRKGIVGAQTNSRLVASLPLLPHQAVDVIDGAFHDLEKSTPLCRQFDTLVPPSKDGKSCLFLGAAALRAANGPLWLCAFNRVRRTSVGAGRETP